MRTQVPVSLRAAMLAAASRIPLDLERKDDGELAELKAAFEKYHDATKGLPEVIQDLKDQMNKMEAKSNRLALGGGAEGEGSGDWSAELKAMGIYARNGDDSELKAVALMVGNDPQGGYLVQAQRSAAMTKKLLDLSPMRRIARVETITTGDAWEEPLDLEQTAATWVGETAERPQTDASKIGMLRIPLHEIYANPKISQRLLDDSGFDVGGWLEGKIGDGIGQKEGAAFINGNGIVKPRGLTDYPTVATSDATRPWGTFQHVLSGGAAGFAAENPADALRSLMWSVRAPYRQGAVWLMNSATAGLVDKFKNEQGDYIWREGQTAGAPASLLGYPVEIDEGMPDVAADALPIAFGNFQQGYLIVDRPGLRVLRDPYTAKPGVLFYAYKRVGGGAANTESIKFLKVGAA